MKIKADLKEYLNTYLESIADSHIEAWKERYYGYTKKTLENDLSINHDNSLELDDAERELKRPLSTNEQIYIINQFHKEVVKRFFK